MFCLVADFCLFQRILLIVFIINLVTKIGNSMDQPSFSVNLQEHKNKSMEDSEDKRDSKNDKKPLRTKIIQKKNKPKSKTKEQPDTMISQDNKSFSLSTPFGIFQSEIQKCQRIEHYLKKDIQNFYTLHLTPQNMSELDNLLEENYFNLKHIVQGDLQEIWPDAQPSILEVWSYLQMVNQIEKSGNTFSTVFDKNSEKYFVCFYFKEPTNYYKVLEITWAQQRLLENRRLFFDMFHNLKNTYNQNHHNLSEIKRQIVYLYKKLCQSTIELETNIQKLTQNISQIQSQNPQPTIHEAVEDKYIRQIMKKLIKTSFIEHQDFDLWNFFRDNEAIEQGFPPETVRLTNQKDFEDFMKRKKNKRGKKGRLALHSGCLACMSPYYETYNPFEYCSECFVRFHRYCYPGMKVLDESTQKTELYCESCYNRKMSIVHRVKQVQCEICSTKGLLNMTFGPNRHMHIFCILANGLWKITNKSLQFDQLKEKNHPMFHHSQKCDICSIVTPFVYNCSQCHKKAHLSCSFLYGWEIKLEFDAQNNSLVKMVCCGEERETRKREKTRKLITNYKKIAYISI